MYVHTTVPDADLTLQFLVHASLDVMEEKGAFAGAARPGIVLTRTRRGWLTTAAAVRKEGDVRDSYLGPLYPSELYRVYG